MKHLKSFEDNKLEPEVGDYVIISKDVQYDSLDDFFNNNIAKIIKIGKNFEDKLLHYYIKMKFDKCFFDPKKDRPFFFGEDTFTKYFKATEIEYFSKNKEEAEAYLASKKYNL